MSSLRRAICRPSQRLQLLALSIATIWLTVATSQTSAQQPPSTKNVEKTEQIEQVVVIGNRTSQSVVDIPRSVTVIAGEQLRDALAKSVDIGDVLGRLVPGMATSADGRNNARGQDQIRGRRFLLLVDGIPQDRTYLDTRQDFKSVSAEAIERIEVMRGGTAVYGLNSTGGIINLITKRGKSGAPQFTSSLKILPNNGGKLGYDIYNHVAGGDERWRYFFGFDYLKSQGRYDANGNLIPSATIGSADFNETKNANIKLSAKITESARIEYTLNAFTSKDHDRYYPCRGILPQQGTLAVTSRFNAVALCGGAAPTALTAPISGSQAEAIRIPIGADEPNNAAAALANGSAPYGFDIRNHALSLDLSETGVGDIAATVYHQARSAVTASFTFNRSAANPGPALGFGYNDLQQSRTGVRTTVDTDLKSLFKDTKLVWGVDAEKQAFSQPNSLNIIPSSPDYAQRTAAPFAQLDASVRSWKISGGLRHETITVDIPTFTIPLTSAIVSRPVEGGTLRFKQLLANVGAVVDVTPRMQAYGSFSQGVTLGELLRAIRSTNRASVAAAVGEIQPVKVDAYEIGLRGANAGLRWSIAAFENKSPLGATITRDPATTSIFTIRAPEKVRGAEATIDWHITNEITTGGAISLQEGRRTLNSVTEALPGTRIAPTKIAAYGKYSWQAAHYMQLDLLHTGNRNRFANGAVNAAFSANVVGGDAEGAGNVTALTLANLSYVRPLGTGKLSLSVVNLMNKNYVPPTLQALNDPRAYYGGQGRAFGASYTLNW